MVAPLAAAAVSSCRWSLTSGLRLILLLGPILTVSGGLVWGSKSVEVQRVSEIFDDRLQFMAGPDAPLLDEVFAGG